VDGNTVVYEFPGDESTHLFRNCAIDGSTLRVVMVDGVLVSATTKDGAVRNTPIASRNEILMHVLYITVGLWVHPATHLGAERVAMSIARQGIAALAPTALFTHTLHDTLLHSVVMSPLCAGNPFVRGPSFPPKVDFLAMCLRRPPHYLSKDAMQFRRFRFFMHARSILSALLAENQLSALIDLDDFFSAVIVHSIDRKWKYPYYSAFSFNFYHTLIQRRPCPIFATCCHRRCVLHNFVPVALAWRWQNMAVHMGVSDIYSGVHTTSSKYSVS
jgi:hypothetical protein